MEDENTDYFTLNLKNTKNKKNNNNYEQEYEEYYYDNYEEFDGVTNYVETNDSYNYNDSYKDKYVEGNNNSINSSIKEPKKEKTNTNNRNKKKDYFNFDNNNNSNSNNTDNNITTKPAKNSFYRSKIVDLAETDNKKKESVNPTVSTVSTVNTVKVEELIKKEESTLLKEKETPVSDSAQKNVTVPDSKVITILVSPTVVDSCKLDENIINYDKKMKVIIPENNINVNAPKTHNYTENPIINNVYFTKQLVFQPRINTRYVNKFDDMCNGNNAILTKTPNPMYTPEIPDIKISPNVPLIIPHYIAKSPIPTLNPAFNFMSPIKANSSYFPVQATNLNNTLEEHSTKTLNENLAEKYVKNLTTKLSLSSKEYMPKKKLVNLNNYI